jgi:hypothetical protein
VIEKAWEKKKRNKKLETEKAWWKGRREQIGGRRERLREEKERKDRWRKRKPERKVRDNR